MSANFPAGLVALLVVSVLIYFGLAQRVLDRMRISDRTALALIAAVIVGSFIDIPVGARLVLNIGGIIVIGLAVWLIFTAGSGFERTRAILATVVTGAALLLLTRFMGANPEEIVLDPLYLYPIVAAICGYLAGRSRRSAFIAAVLGVASLDIGRAWFLYSNQVAGTIHLGGAGFFDTLMLSGILAVILAEVVGELRERLQGGPSSEDRDPELLRHLKGPEPVFNLEAGELGVGEKDSSGEGEETAAKGPSVSSNNESAEEQEDKR